MIIAVDQALSYFEEAFSDLGGLRPFSGRNPKPEDIRQADAIIVRSVTPVDASLLEGSSVRFVGAASAGIDHIDQDYLKKRGIGFCYAPGCNAESVSEYVVTVLHVIASRKNWKLKGKSLAVIGVGNVGSRVARKAHALGMEVLLCDPPLRDATGDVKYQSFNDVLGADVLSFHVPLVLAPPYPTWHLVDRKILNRLSSKQFLINTSRGAVFDNQELRLALQENRLEGAVLDVWEGEPLFDHALLRMVDIGTPHIAGTALDSKIRATEMTRTALCEYFGLHPARNLDFFYPKTRILCPDPETQGQDSVLSVLLQAFNILKPATDFKALAGIPLEEAAARFEHMRITHPLRPEFRHFTVDLDKRHIDLTEIYAGLGFQTREAE
jgi:erythronate-4-phosphate dehydrogenase